MAKRSRDSRQWTPADALRDLLDDIEAGRTQPEKLAVHWVEPVDEGRALRHRYCAAGLTYEAHVALLELAKQRCIEDWLA